LALFELLGHQPVHKQLMHPEKRRGAFCTIYLIAPSPNAHLPISCLLRPNTSQASLAKSIRVVVGIAAGGIGVAKEPDNEPHSPLVVLVGFRAWSCTAGVRIALLDECMRGSAQCAGRRQPSMKDLSP
jgi:hypothetical protein